MRWFGGYGEGSGAVAGASTADPSVDPEPAASPPASARHLPDWPDRQAFWTLIVGAPLVLSVLRLWVEAGGELQTTLLLVANVDPINLIAAFVVTASWLAATVLVAVFAVGGVLLANEAATGGRDTLPRWLFARWRAAAPPWLTIGCFLLGALTWEILFLPLLLLAACAAFQISPWRQPRRWLRLLAALLALVVYSVVLWPTISLAYNRDEVVVVGLLLAPVLLALAIAGPIATFLVRPFAITAHGAVAALTLLAVWPFMTTPVLPLNVVVAGPAGSPPTYLRGHVVLVDDVHTVVLRDRGGVEYVPNGQIRSQVLCPSDEETPRFRLWVYGVHVEDSVLRGIGRSVRPIARERPECRVEVDPVS